MARSRKGSIREAGGIASKKKSKAARRDREQGRKMLVYAVIATIVLMGLAYLLVR